MEVTYPTKAWTAYKNLMRERPALFRQDERLSIVTDEEVVRAFEAETGRSIGVVYRSPYHLMVVDLVRSPSGRPFAYERLVPASTGSAVVTIPRWQNHYVLLRQFRHSLRGEQIAFPRGFGEDGLSAEENAAKELEEELGTRVLSTQRIGTVVADSGVSGSGVAFLLCEIERPVLKKGYEGIQDVIMLEEGTLRQWVLSGKVNDGYTLSAWGLVEAQQAEARQGSGDASCMQKRDALG